MTEMKILKLSPYCEPERISSSHLTDDVNKAAIDSGFTIENIVPAPCRGIDEETRKKYRKIRQEKLYGGKYVIRRFPMFKEGKNPLIRAFRYILVNVIQYFKGCRAEDVSVILAGSTPPTQGMLCALVKTVQSRRQRKNIPFVYRLQDVFPDSLVTAGYTKKGSILWKIGRKIEDYTYKKADLITVLSEDIKKNIMDKGVPGEKIRVLPNWIDTDMVFPVSKEENRLFKELGVDPACFTVTYAGNAGTAQAVDTILDAAEFLKDHADVRFVFFAAGRKLEEVRKRIDGMRNVSLFPLMPQDRLPEVYSMGDLSIVACRKGVGSGAIPSKTYSIMAAGTPVLLSFDEDSDLWRMIREKDCGYAAPAGDPCALAEQILYAYDHRQELIEKGNNALKTVKAEYSAMVVPVRYVKMIRDTAEGV